MNTKEIAAEYRLTHWAQVMQDRQGSGMSIKAFCETKGYHENVYYYWQKKLREAACEQLTTEQDEKTVPHGFTAVRLVKRTPQLSCQETSPHGQICIETAGVRISTSSTYPAEMLAMLLREVARPC